MCFKVFTLIPAKDDDVIQVCHHETHYNLEEPLKLIAENKQVLGLDQKALLLQIDIYQRG